MMALRIGIGLPRRVVAAGCFVAATVWLGLAVGQAANDPTRPERPNFLVVLADDCTHRDLGCYGGQAHTPHIDRLASQGMRMTQCFQAAPMCSPTRHNLYTGLYPVRSGAHPNHTYARKGTRSVAHYLSEAGYRVALSGKRHINPPEVFPFEYSGRKNPDWDAVGHLMRECSEDATPFCLYLCSNEPHTPWDKGDRSRYPADQVRLPDYLVDTPETRRAMSAYLAEVTYFDGQVGQALEMLERYALADNTVVIVLSEQGASFPFGKWTCYDTGLASAMIVRWPGVVEADTTSDALVEYVDVLPTLLEAAGTAVPPALEGRSLLPVLSGRTAEHKEYVFGIQTSRGIINGPEGFPIRSVRSDRFKYIRNLMPEASFTNVLTRPQEDVFESWRREAARGNERARERVYRYQHRPAEELYDLRADPLEWRNLADDPAYADVKQRLGRQLNAWMKDQGDGGRETEMNALDRQYRHRK